MSLDQPHLLTTSQVAQFTARGCLELPGLVPADINAHYLTELADRDIATVVAGTPLSQAYPAPSAIRRFVDDPGVAGVIHSLVGPDPLVDHHFTHRTFSPATLAKKGLLPADSQHWHQDSTIDTRLAFDIQLMWFPHAVTPDMGGTRYLPGSHLRIVSEAAIGRYQNILGQRRMACEAGTVLVLHSGLWHGAGANRATRDRHMFKIRLNPTVPQVRLWDTRDLDARQGRRHPIFYQNQPRGNDDLQAILCEMQPWYEADTGRLEMINRVRMWRYLTGDATFDADYWLGRLENQPGRRLESASGVRA